MLAVSCKAPGKIGCLDFGGGFFGFGVFLVWVGFF